MQAIPYFRLAVAGLLLLMASGCGTEPGGTSGFQKQYSDARASLEAGKYEQASRQYARLLPQAGPLRPRLQLEYAHSELRAGHYAEAARLAADLAQSQKGQDRAAALAVQGTAQHELGLVLAQKGDAAAMPTLKAAHAALSEVVKSYPDLDPLGSLAGRRAAIEARLKRM